MFQTDMAGKEDLKKYLDNSENLIVMYVGNLESYQGIDLLLQSFSIAAKQSNEFELMVIGGEEADIAHYTQVSEELTIGKRVHFLGQRPVELLSYYLGQADILVSPRTKGKNTPMKIYSYLGSGKPVVATNLETHTQVLTSDVSVLVSPDPSAFSEGLLKLVESSELRKALGESGKQMVHEHFSLAAFKKRANSLLDWVQESLMTNPVSIA